MITDEEEPCHLCLQHPSVALVRPRLEPDQLLWVCALCWEQYRHLVMLVKWRDPHISPALGLDWTPFVVLALCIGYCFLLLVVVVFLISPAWGMAP